jgi:hypothetical protein
MADLNWNMAQVPNMFAAGVEGRRAGVQDRNAATAQSALALYGKDPEAGINALRPVDPEAAMRLEQERERKRIQQQAEERDKASRAALAQAQGGDYQGAQTAAGGDADTLAAISKMSASQRQEAQDRANVLAGLFTDLSGQTYDQRLQAIADAAPGLIANGLFTEQQIAGFDPTDGNVSAQRAQALGYTGMLEQANKDREFQLKSDNIAADNQRGERQVGIAQQRVGIAAQRANRAPAARGGSGGGLPPAVTDAATFAQLPSGTLFLAPDGTTRRKP